MAIEIYMPQLGLTMTEGTVTRWLKRTGDAVRQGEPVVEIETDKVTTEIEAPTDGILGPILVKEGEKAPIGGVLTYLLAEGDSMPEAPQPELVAAIPSAPATPSPEPSQAPSQGVERVIATPRARRKAHELGVDLSQVPASGPGGRIVEADVRWFADQKAEQEKEAPRVSPVARRLAAELGVDLSTVQGTGEGGRIRREDVERAAAARQAAAAAVPPPAAPAAPAGAVEALTGVRRIVAERMARNFTTTPHFYLTAEVDASALTRMRDGLLPRIETTTGIRLTITDILVKVCAHALREHPEINVAYAEVSGGPGLVRQTEVNVGVAVALEDGLVVPVIRQADRLSLAEIAAKRAELVERARAGTLSLFDLEGGTFTLTNLGMFGVDQFQAIINSPQAAILAVGRVRERPVAIGGAVLIRPTLYLTLSLDHRLVDGAQGARFLERLAQLIEEPYLLLD
ncbi:MAG: dihydrolipoamide acetyltransferase family protein [Anaerolineae bacterium]